MSHSEAEEDDELLYDDDAGLERDEFI